jgi:hypothetical protein
LLDPLTEGCAPVFALAREKDGFFSSEYWAFLGSILPWGNESGSEYGWEVGAAWWMSALLLVYIGNCVRKREGGAEWSVLWVSGWFFPVKKNASGALMKGFRF